MLFTYDTEATLALTGVLVNSVEGSSHSNEDELSTIERLDALLDEHEYSGRRDHSAAELAEVRALRVELREFWNIDRGTAVERVNGILHDAHAVPRLVRHGGWDWHLHATEPDAPLATRIRVEVAMAVIDVLRLDELDRFRICAADDCEAVLVDLSRNRSKRYCDVGNCGNRMNVNAYRARRGEGGRSSG